jgi:hypothetical protein
MSQVDLKEGMIVNLVKINEKPVVTSASGTDVLPVTDPVTGAIKQITVTNFLSPVFGGVGIALTTTTPISNINTYSVSGGAGTYTDFLSAASTPIVFDNTTDSMATKEWQMRKNPATGYWFKYEYKTANTYAQSGGSVKTLNVVDLDLQQSKATKDIVIKTSTFAALVASGALLQLDVYNGDPTKRLYLKSFTNYWGSNHYTDLIFDYEGSGFTGQGAFGIYHNVTGAALTGIVDLYLPPRNGTKMFAFAKIDYDKIASGATYTYADFAGGGIDTRVINRQFSVNSLMTLYPYLNGTAFKIVYKSATYRLFDNSSNFLDFPIADIIQDIKVTGLPVGAQVYPRWIGANSGNGGTRSYCFFGVKLADGTINDSYFGDNFDGLDITVAKTHTFTNSGSGAVLTVKVNWQMAFPGVTWNIGAVGIATVAENTIQYIGQGIEYAFQTQRAGKPTTFRAPIDTVGGIFLNGADFSGGFEIKGFVEYLRISNARKIDKFHMYWMGKQSGTTTPNNCYFWVAKTDGDTGVVTPQYMGFVDDTITPTGIKYYEDDGSAGEHIDFGINWDKMPVGVTFNLGTYAKAGISNYAISYREDVPVQQAYQRPLFPDTYWALKGIPFNLYGRNMKTGFDYNNQVKIILNKVISGTPNITNNFYIGDCTKINPEDLGANGDTFRQVIAYMSGENVNAFLQVGYKDAKIRYADPALISSLTTAQKSFEVCPIGDSMLHNKLSYLTGIFFTAKGATPRWIGTQFDAADTGHLYGNEGRPGWDGKTMIGARSTNPDNTPCLPGNGINKNPWLKVATSVDWLAHPEWVFENNAAHGDGQGRFTELNYTQSQAIGTYVGSYYIFDWARYFTVTGLATPDPTKMFIVPYLHGFNGYPEDSFEHLAQEIIIKKTREFRSDAVVGICPINTFSGNANAEWFNSYIEKTIKNVKIFRTTLSFNVFTINTFAMVDRWTAYGYTGTTPFAANNDCYLAQPADATHPDENGRPSLADQIICFLANVMKSNF